MNNYIKELIKVNEFATKNIAELEDVCKNDKIENEKDKANFGNICVALRGFRMVAEATEAMLINENVLQDENGDWYHKIEDDETSDDVSDNNPNNNSEAPHGEK